MSKLTAYKEEIEKKLLMYLPRNDVDNGGNYNGRVIDAMKYSFMIGGKRIRPLLMLAGYKIIHNNDELDIVYPYMAALEMIHTYSLIHDDLPAMDDDELRRGKPTCHLEFDEATAILAGDGLLNLSIEVISNTLDNRLLKGEVSESDISKFGAMIKAQRLLFHCSGIYGMIGGQAADILFESKEESSVTDLKYIHEHKTGAMIKAALMIGGILNGAKESEVLTLERIGDNIGLAFQIQDDILDCISTEEELGKPIGSDVKNNKTTYVSHYGLEKAKLEVEKLINESLQLSQNFTEGNNEILAEILEFLNHRTY